MRATYMEELEFLRMQPLHLMSQSWRSWLLGMLALVLLLVKVKFEVKLLILMMKKLEFDCLIDYLLFSFSFNLVGHSKHHGMFQLLSTIALKFGICLYNVKKYAQQYIKNINKNIFNNFLIAESRRTRTHLFQKLLSPAPAPAPTPKS